MKTFYRRHKKAAMLISIAALSISFMFLCFGWIVIRTWMKAPVVAALATSPEKVRLQLEDISDEYQNILLAVEDPGFYDHHGVDFNTPGAGWTTITQAIVKVYFYNGFTPGFLRYRKLEQSVIAWVFDMRVDKRTQLLIFVNSAYFGNHNGREIVGFEDASRAYFNTTFTGLSKNQFLSLVAMLIGPNEFHVDRQPVRNRERVQRIQRLLMRGCTPNGFRDVYYESCQ
ncbi:MAG TPA: biosynthetic peptidoglycan transglycosylase [Pyrinomonadaceae bacterium]|nr:biosynthetic peptidoglycan transglycosylase [Pyrinomonadaceae bacterium]